MVFPELPGCAAPGPTCVSTLRLAASATRKRIRLERAAGHAIPPPRDPRYLVHDPEIGKALREGALFSSSAPRAGLILARRLTEIGIPKTDTSFAAKINRGAFPAWFLFAVMRLSASAPCGWTDQNCS